MDRWRTMGGVNDWYSILYEHCIEHSDSYFRCLDAGLFHTGDEFLTTLAIAKIREDGLLPFNVGVLNGIHRYWGMMEQKSPENYKVAFLHLPSDKYWTASLSLQNINNREDWLKQYRRHRIGLHFKKIIKRIICR